MKASRVTPFLVLQFCVALLVLALASFRPGEWNTVRWAGLIIAILAAVPLFVARYQLGKSFSVTPQARELVTHGIYSKIRNLMFSVHCLLSAYCSLFKFVAHLCLSPY